MRVTIDDDNCRGHGVCCTVCPDVFDINDDGYAEVLLDVIPAGLEDSVRKAAANCPERAITVS
ncbi:ferredoxin [Actinocorallia populi]|uniref:ferredoxin n=1 Tax=Actinocorallia populi TaxID=2079200 RepID=UPI000D0976CA|nr:ferredoxin [Actinocorallia populi]